MRDDDQEIHHIINQYVRDPDGVTAIHDLIAARDRRIAELEMRLAKAERATAPAASFGADFQPFIDQLRSFIWILSPDGRIMRANQAVLTFMGVTEADIRNQAFVDSPVLHRLDVAQEIFIHALQDAQAGIETRHGLELQAADGSLMAVDLMLHAVKDDGGHLDYLILCAQDMTEQVERQRQLETVNQWQYALLDNVHQGIWIVNHELVTLYINAYLHDLLGYTDRDMVGMDLQQIIAPGYLDEFHDQLVRALRGQPSETEIPIKCADGEFLWMQTSLTPLHTAQDGQYDTLIVLKDVTERRAHEIELAEKEALYRSVLSAMSEGVVMQDRDGTIRTMNRSAPRLLGLTEDQMMGRSSFDPDWRAIYPDGTPFPGEQHPAMVALRTGQPQHAVIMGVQKPDHTLTWIRINAVPLFEAGSDEPSSVVATFTDITEQHQAEARRFDLALERERIRILSGFIRDASHEFRNPLANIQTSTYILQKKFCQQGAQPYLDRINSKVASINYLIDHLVLMHRLDSGETVSMMSTPVKDILEGALKDFVNKMPQTLIVEDHASPLTIRCHVEYLIIALESLIDNATRFTPDDGQITVTLHRTAQHIVFEVSDTGVGMTPEQLEHAFERFYRADDARSRQGFGLGLPVVKRIVELHGGNIRLETQVNQGTTVQIMLPL